MEREFNESRNEVHQVMAELEMLKQTIDRRNQQVQPLENEIGYIIIYDEIQLMDSCQAGRPCRILFYTWLESSSSYSLLVRTDEIS